MNTRNITLTVASAVLLLALLLVGITGGPQALAAPLAAPTPVAGTYTGGGAAKTVNLYNGVVVTSTAVNGTGVSILTGDRVDLQYVIDQTDVNTVTAKLQFSNDGVNWIDGATFATANAADANEMQQYSVFGALARVNVAATNTNPVTVTVIGVVKQAGTMATPTADQLSRLRRMVAEPGATNGYTDTVLAEVLARYPVPDAAGVYPVDENGVADATWDATSLDGNAAAAEIWTEKAAALAATYDFSADGGDFKRSQAVKQAREMAGFYASRRYARGVRIKADINPGIESSMWIFNLPETD